MEQLPGIEDPRDPRIAARARRWHRTEQALWAALGVFVLAGLLGLLGGGPLSKGVARDESGLLTVDYGRVEHRGSSVDLRIMTPPIAGESFVVEIGRDYLDRMHLQEAVPAPVRMEAHEGGVAMHFAHAGPEERAVIRLRFDSYRAGVARAVVRSGDRIARFTQVSLP